VEYYFKVKRNFTDPLFLEVIAPVFRVFRKSF